MNWMLLLTKMSVMLSEKSLLEKKRIASGNFQNLNRFKHLLFPPIKGISFSFWSHKVLRWFGPFFMILALLFNALLFHQSVFYELLFFGQLFVWSLPLVDALLSQVGIHNKLLRFVSHLFGMNLALLFGFVAYTKGIKTNIWTPTERNQ